MLTTRNFGEIEIDENEIIYFEEGLPGLNQLKKFIILGDEGDKPFCFMQSVDDGKTCLILLPPLEILEGYSFEIDDDVVERLGEIRGNNLAIFSVVVMTDKIENMTTNLKAPIIINVETRRGLQYIINDDQYHIKYSIYNELVTFIKKGGESSC